MITEPLSKIQSRGRQLGESKVVDVIDGDVLPLSLSHLNYAGLFCFKNISFNLVSGEVFYEMCWGTYNIFSMYNTKTSDAEKPLNCISTRGAPSVVDQRQTNKRIGTIESVSCKPLK